MKNDCSLTCSQEPVLLNINAMKRIN